MAAPKLKTGGGPIAGPLSLRPSGMAPAKAVRLKGINGKTITPKAPAKTAASAPDDAAQAAEAAADEEAAAAAKAAEEQATAEAAAQAEAEAAAAQAEYERQMEEYNRQMEEYNRQMAELKAAEEAAAKAEAEAKAAEEAVAAEAAAKAEAEKAAAEPAPIVEAPEPVAAPAAAVAAPAAAKPKAKVGGLSVAKPAAAKLGVAKPAAAKAGVAKPAAKTAAAKPAAAKKATPPAPPTEGAEPAEGAMVETDGNGMSEADLDARDAYLAALQAAADAKPIWKRLPFLLGVGALVLLATICTVVVVQHNAQEARIKAHRDYINSLLKRAQSINQKGVETQADAKAKGVDVTCSTKDAKALLEVVVHPDAVNEKGQPLYGGNPEGVAQNACLLLGLAAEADDTIADTIFNTMGAKAKTIRPTLFNWLIQRMAISDSKNVQKNFKKLATTVAAKPDWPKKSEVLSYVYNGMGLRVTKDDVPAMTDLLGSDKTDSQLAKALAVCLDNVLEMMEDDAEKARIADTIFEKIAKLPEKKRNSTLRQLVPTLAKAKSTKGLEYYKKELDNPKTWAKGFGLTYLGYWGDDSQIDYIVGLMNKAPDDRAKEQVKQCLGSVFAQSRDRSDEVVNKLLGLYYDSLDADLSKMKELIEKTDEVSEKFVGADSPELPKLKEELKKFEGMKMQKKGLLNVLKTMDDYPWVEKLLDKYAKDPDSDIVRMAEQAKEQVKVNSVNRAKRRDDYKARSK